MPNELELIALKTEFDLYLAFTKRLVLNLPNTDDRTKAAMWLQKLRSIEDDNQKKLRNEHLKLMLFALHRRSMVGVFAKPPPDAELESFHDGLTLLEMTRELIEITEKALANAGGDSGECPLPAIVTNVSADLKEYCATQTIPKFGTHVYYAISNEPIQMWTKSPNCVYPSTSDMPNPLQWELLLSKVTDHVLEKQAEADRLAAEAEADKDGEEDTIQVLPKVEVKVCPSIPPFKWKADSKLVLHQNYDFSDVGVAENMEAQGKHQLELDEMAFSLLDQSLPGRQRIVVRDPYFRGLPPDLAERRHHGVIDEVSEDEESSEEDCPPPPPPPCPPLPCPPPVCPPPPPVCPPPPSCPPPPPACPPVEQDPCQDDYGGWDNAGYDECDCPPQDDYGCAPQQEDMCANYDGGWDQGGADYGGYDCQGGGGGQFDDWLNNNQNMCQQTMPSQQDQCYGNNFQGGQFNQMDQMNYNEAFGCGGGAPAEPPPPPPPPKTCRGSRH